LNLWCANDGLEASNEWRDNVSGGTANISTTAGAISFRCPTWVCQITCPTGVPAMSFQVTITTPPNLLRVQGGTELPVAGNVQGTPKDPGGNMPDHLIISVFKAFYNELGLLEGSVLCEKVDAEWKMVSSPTAWAWKGIIHVPNDFIGHCLVYATAYDRLNVGVAESIVHIRVYQILN
jgi:hypothetical protein